MGDDNGLGIPLAATLEHLRSELQTAIEAGAQQELRFHVESLEVALTVTVTRDIEAGGGIKFWVLNASGKTKAGELNTHVVKLRLAPRNAAGEQITVSGEETAKPVFGK